MTSLKPVLLNLITVNAQCYFYTVSAEKPRYAESWDFEVSGSSFLQFELSMGCSKSTAFSHGVRLEYSTDCGHHWTLITPECVPPAIGCAGYTQSSIYTSTQYKHWRRITVYLPSAAKYVFYTLISNVCRRHWCTWSHFYLEIAVKSPQFPQNSIPLDPDPVYPRSRRMGPR